MSFEEFLRQQYNLGEKSVKDYKGRLNGLESRGIYKEETQLTPEMITAIEGQYKKNSWKNYLLTIEYHIEYLEKQRQLK